MDFDTQTLSRSPSRIQTRAKSQVTPSWIPACLKSLVLAYRAWNLTSFNFAMIGGGPLAGEQGYQVVLKVLSRSNPEPRYRSDATYFERLLGEALIDRSPEEVADGIRAKL